MAQYRSRFIGVVTSLNAYPSYVPQVKGTRVALRNTDDELGGSADIIIPLGENVPALGATVVMSADWQDDIAQDAPEFVKQRPAKGVSILDVAVTHSEEGSA